MNRIRKHDLLKGRVAVRLRRMGLRVFLAPKASAYDLLVGDDVRVALRAAFPGMRRHQVTINGRRYQYRYRAWHFNFHHHGKLESRYADLFVCVAVNPHTPSTDQSFVIPWEKVTGKTFALHDGRKAYTGRYAAFRDQWVLIAAAAGQTAPLKRVA